jgi:hypothetical protein
MKNDGRRISNWKRNGETIDDRQSTRRKIRYPFFSLAE